MLRPALAVVALALALPAGASAQYEVTRPILFASCFGAGCPSPPYVAEPPYNYPSQLGVAGAGNYLTGVRVTLSNIAHGNSQDLDTLLVGPGGQKAIVESDIGGSAIADTWTFDDFAASEAPRVASSGTWKPTNWDEPSADTFPPAFTSARNPPAPPYPPTLAGFFGTNPNGEWRLYTVDDDPLLYGTIGNGWRLDLETGPGNPALIAAASDAPSAATYPAQLPVSGLSGEIADVDVNLTGLSHAHPDDLDVVLVSPQGQKVMLTSDAGGAVPAVNAVWRFDDAAPAAMPDAGAAPTARYRPADYEPGESLPAPAPGAPYAGSLRAFEGADPNGTWRLYVADDRSGDPVSIARGFGLTIKTRPVTPPAPAATGTEGGAGGAPASGGSGGAPASGGAGAGTTPLAPASVSGLALKPRAFRVRGRRAGTTIGFRLSRAASVTFTVERADSGRRSGRRCVKNRRSGRRCTVWTKLKSTFARKGKAGTNRLRWDGKLGGRALSPGSYRLVATPAGGRAVRGAFRVTS
jgi:subtilisin-like proprotein convertase family protein